MSVSGTAPAYGGGVLGAYPFAAAAVDGGAVPTTTLGMSCAGALPAMSTSGAVVPTTTLGMSYVGGLPVITTFTSVSSFVSQALTACTLGAKALAGEPPVNLTAGDYISVLAQATSLLLDFQRSAPQLTVGSTDIKEACQPLLGEDADFSGGEKAAELEHAASILRDFYAQIGRNSPQIVILLTFLTAIIAILAWFYPRSSGGTTIHIDLIIQSGTHVCRDGLPSP